MFIDEKNKFTGEPLDASRLRLKEVKTAPFSPEAFAAWIATHRPDKTYNWDCTDGTCLIGQYARHIGYGHLKYSEFSDELMGRNLEDNFVRVACNMGMRSGWTFGAALERARKLLLQGREASGSPNSSKEG